MLLRPIWNTFMRGCVDMRTISVFTWRQSMHDKDNTCLYDYRSRLYRVLSEWLSFIFLLALTNWTRWKMIEQEVIRNTHNILKHWFPITCVHQQKVNGNESRRCKADFIYDQNFWWSYDTPYICQLRICTAINTRNPARTIHSLLSIPNNLKRMKKLSDSQLTYIRSIIGSSKILIIDEISFASPALILQPLTFDFRLSTFD